MAKVSVWQPTGVEIVHVRLKEISNLAAQSQGIMSFEAPE